MTAAFFSSCRSRTAGLIRRARGFLIDLVYPENAVCLVCGAIPREGCLCDRCRESLRSDGFMLSWSWRNLDGVSAYSLRPHEGVPRQLILRLKHSAAACAADELASLLLPLPSFLSFPPDTVVTWVAMPASRRRERCIDHGRLLAEAAARRLGLRCSPLLKRRDDRFRTQATLGRQARMRNLSGAFAPACEIAFPVLLVDDVLTTGTTAKRCIAALQEGGAKDITVITMTTSRRQ